jgi:hypothetical protein
MTPSELMKLDRCERLLLVQRSVFESLADYDDQEDGLTLEVKAVME